MRIGLQIAPFCLKLITIYIKYRGGVMSQHTKYTPREERKWFLWSWLALVVIYNLFTIVSFLTGGNNPLAYIASPDNNNLFGSPAVVLVNLASAAAIIFCIVIVMGYKIGYYGLVLAYIVMTLASLTLGFNIGMVLASGLVALITWGVLQPSWSRMK
jgi:hypothetical protein